MSSIKNNVFFIFYYCYMFLIWTYKWLGVQNDGKLFKIDYILIYLRIFRTIDILK